MVVCSGGCRSCIRPWKPERLPLAIHTLCQHDGYHLDHYPHVRRQFRHRQWPLEVRLGVPTRSCKHEIARVYGVGVVPYGLILVC